MLWGNFNAFVPSAASEMLPRAMPTDAAMPVLRDSCGIPAGAQNARGMMGRRCASGPGCRGEREEQPDVRGHLVDAVAGSLREAAVPWCELPHALESWDVLFLLIQWR